jgi:hypothetical protein
MRVVALQEQWVSGDFTYPTGEATTLANAKAIAECQVYRDVLEIDHLTILGELSDEQSGRQPSDDEGDDDE